MIIAVDTLFLSKRFRHTGTGVYLSHVLSECLRIAETEESNIEFHGFMAPDDNWAINGLASSFLQVHKTSVLSQRRLFLLGGMAVLRAFLRPDLVFLPTSQGAIPGPFAPLVTTILDAIPRRLPQEMVKDGRTAHYTTWMNAKLARKIITISRWSKQDLVEIYNLDPEKVEVIYLGYDKHLYNEAPTDPEVSDALLARLGIHRPFILHHGMVELRKNVHMLIQAWDRVKERNRNFDVQLVLAGSMGLGHEQILKVREASANRNQIILTGALPDTELATIVKNAFLCVIPSLYEGFCLPMVEAMACGVPTVSSNSSCLPEVSGGVLEYFNPYSVEEMSETVRRVLEDSGVRNRLREQGLARVSEFSWNRCARETLNVFQSILTQSSK